MIWRKCQTSHERYDALHRTGKVADLVLVEGDPSKRIGDLRNTRIVMMAGTLMNADELRKASGFTGRPKMPESLLGN